MKQLTEQEIAEIKQRVRDRVAALEAAQGYPVEYYIVDIIRAEEIYRILLSGEESC